MPRVTSNARARQILACCDTEEYRRAHTASVAQWAVTQARSETAAARAVDVKPQPQHGLVQGSKLKLDFAVASQCYAANLTALDQLRAVGLINLTSALSLARLEQFSGKPYAGEFDADELCDDDDICFVNFAQQAQQAQQHVPQRAPQAAAPAAAASQQLQAGAADEREASRDAKRARLADAAPPAKRPRASLAEAIAISDDEEDRAAASASSAPAAAAPLDNDNEARAAAPGTSAPAAGAPRVRLAAGAGTSRFAVLSVAPAAAAEEAERSDSDDDDEYIDSDATEASASVPSGRRKKQESLLTVAMKQRGPGEAIHVARALGRYVEAALSLSRPFGQQELYAGNQASRAYAFDLCMRFITALVKQQQDSASASRPSAQAQDDALLRDAIDVTDLGNRPMDALMQYFADIGILVKRAASSKSNRAFLDGIVQRANFPAEKQKQCRQRLRWKLRAASVLAQVMVQAGTLAVAVPIVLCGCTFSRHYISNGDAAKLMPGLFGGDVASFSASTCLSNNQLLPLALQMSAAFWKPLIASLHAHFPFTRVCVARSSDSEWDLSTLKSLISSKKMPLVDSSAAAAEQRRRPTLLASYDRLAAAVNFQGDWSRYADERDAARLDKQYDGTPERPDRPKRTSLARYTGVGIPPSTTWTLHVTRGQVKLEA